MIWTPTFDGTAFAAFAAAAGQTAFPDDAEAANDLLRLLLEARTSQPTPKWLARWREGRKQVDAGPLRSFLLQLAEYGNRTMHGWGPSAGDPAVTAARGALWALAEFQDADTRDFLATTVLDWSRSGTGSPALGHAAIWALAAPGDEEGIRRLLALQSKIAHKNLRTRLDRSLASITESSGVSPEELADRQAPGHGLDEHRRRTWDIQDYRITVRLASSGAVEREFVDPEGDERKSVPSRIRHENPDLWLAVTQETRALRSTLSLQRARLEEAMVSGRTWTASSWRELIGRHPVLGSLASRLVWRIDLPMATSWHFALPIDDAWYDEQGGRVTVPDRTVLSIAHPLHLPDALQQRWQQRVVEQRIVQPFKQVFRETYVITAAEEEAISVSARFTGLPVPLHAIYALARTRGWSGPLGQTFFDGAGEGYREFTGENIRVVLRHSVSATAMAVVESVHFERNTARAGARRKAWSPMRLSDVPPVPFSEAMRDVDLMVSVAALGTAAQWQEWEEARAAGRADWLEQQRQYALLLPETSLNRAALLRELIPILGLSDQVQIRDHFALVRGRRSEYRIHLGTGNIHLEPAGRYLCIVPARNQNHLYLPFEEDDAKTSEIISKIVLLARDDIIQDRSILRQLPMEDP